MNTRRITRFRSRRPTYGNPGFWARIQMRGGAMLVGLGGLAIALLLGGIPWYWSGAAAVDLSNDWGTTIFAGMSQVEEHWKSFPHLPDFTRGDEPGVRAFLLDQPLAVAVQDRFDPKPLWLRQGDRLVRAGESPTVQRYRQWVTQAEMAQRFDWIPGKELDPEYRTTASIVLLGDRWLIIKRWVVGSPQVEAELRHVLRTPPAFRVGLLRPDGGRMPKPAPWGAEPNLQADTPRVVDSVYSSGLTSNAFPGWSIAAIPFEHDVKLLDKERRRQVMMASGFSLVISATLALGLLLRWRARQRALLDANRLASLTHSLKTPLAILKFRCDSIRLGRLSPDQTDAELIQLGEEVDHLTLIIEAGLQAIRGTPEVGPQAEVTPSWLADIAEDLAPVFESEDRVMELRLAQDTGRAALPSLRAAIFTLLENALFHGDGVVSLETYRVRKRLVIKVTDEGHGVDALSMEALGKPFMRLRAKGHEGFRREGQGLGISLLCQVARKEGWGLSFSSEPGRGFQALLEIQAV